MKVSYYFDDNAAAKPVVSTLRSRRIEATTSDEAGNRGAQDTIHLEFAAGRGLVLVTGDRGDFHALFAAWAARGQTHSGIVIVKPRMAMGDQIRALAALHEGRTAEDMRDQLDFLSRWL